MSELKQKLRELQLKKARLYFNIESLSEVNDSLYLQLGKIAAEIMKIEKLLIREIENPLGES
jgi:hypothetical protein